MSVRLVSGPVGWVADRYYVGLPYGGALGGLRPPEA